MIDDDTPADYSSGEEVETVDPPTPEIVPLGAPSPTQDKAAEASEICDRDTSEEMTPFDKLRGLVLSKETVPTTSMSGIKEPTSFCPSDTSTRLSILGLPRELRLRIYLLIHERPRITIQPRAMLLMPKILTTAYTQVRRLNFTSDNPKYHLAFNVTFEDYNWSYLLTCRMVHQEAQHLLPQMLHLIITEKNFKTQYISPHVRDRYLPHISVLTMIGYYPVYDTVFDGSQLASLNALYLIEEDAHRSSFMEEYSCPSPPPPELIGRILGACDHEYMQRSIDQLEESRSHWWQAHNPVWLHEILSAGRSRKFHLIFQQYVKIRLGEFVPYSSYTKVIELVSTVI